MELAAKIERRFGSPVVDSTPGPAPGGSKNRTSIIELQSGRRLVVQQYTNARTAAVRLRAVEQLATPLNQHGIPVPRLLVNGLSDEPPGPRSRSCLVNPAMLPPAGTSRAPLFQ